MGLYMFSHSSMYSVVCRSILNERESICSNIGSESDSIVSPK